MKKLLGFFIAALLIFGLAGQGMAAFADLNLVRTVYDTTASNPKEVGSNLGNNAFSTAGAYGSNMNVGDLLSKGAFAGDLSALKVSYYAVLPGATGDYWVTSTVNTGLSMLGRKGTTNIDPAWSALKTYYNSLGSGNTVTGATTELSSYFQRFDKNGTAVGSFSDSMPSGSFNATVSLADLAGSNHSVDTYLYYFDYNGSTTTKVGTLVATIRTYMTAGADGDFATLSDNMIGSTINPSAAPVPVPPSVYLLGAGLLGLIGIRRRKA